MELSIGEAVNLTRDREKLRTFVATSASANDWRKREEREIGTMDVDGWVGTARTAGAAARPGPSSLYQM